MSRAGHWYAGLLDASDDLWTEYPDARRWLRVLGRLGVEQYRPLALAACPNFAGYPKRMKALFRVIAITSLRADTVLKINSGDIYRAWNRAAIAVSEKRAIAVRDIAREVRDIYGDDDQFQSAFERLSLSATGLRKKLLRYIIAELESDASGRSVDWETDGFTLEHVLPEAESEAWSLPSDEDERFVSRLGNFVPLEPSLNRRAAQLGFKEKLEIYGESKYALARSVAGEEWAAEAIRQRSAHYAARARHIWRVDLE